MADLRITVDAPEPKIGFAGHVASLDGCRAVAALAVVCFHVSFTPTRSDTVTARYSFELGNFGVAVFFLLSGFLLYRPLVKADLAGRSHGSVVQFYRKRFFRIFPAFWLALTAVVIIDASRRPEDLRGWAIIYGLLQIYPKDYQHVGLFVAWTLCIEVAFYLALPAIAWAIRRFVNTHPQFAAPKAHLIGVAAVFAIGISYRLLIIASASSVRVAPYSWLPNFLDWFALGMMFAVGAVWRERGGTFPPLLERLIHAPWICWLFAAELYWASAQINIPRGFYENPSGVQSMGRFLLSGLAAAFFLAPAVFAENRPGPARILASPWLSSVGLVSYGIYLWHVVFLYYVGGWIRDGLVPDGFLPVLAAVLLPTLIVATLTYVFVEKPAQALGRTPVAPGVTKRARAESHA